MIIKAHQSYQMAIFRELERREIDKGIANKLAIFWHLKKGNLASLIVGNRKHNVFKLLTLTRKRE